MDNLNLQYNEKAKHNLTRPRRTSSQIISEAKGFLNIGNGARVIKTNRPITPNSSSSNNRQLFGNVQIKGRPQSSLNPLFFQNQAHVLPELDGSLKAKIDEMNHQKLKNDVTKLPSLDANLSLQASSKKISPHPTKKDKINNKHQNVLYKSVSYEDEKSIKINELTHNKIMHFVKLVQEFQATQKLTESTTLNLIQSLMELKTIKFNKIEETQLLSYLFILVECDSIKILILIAEIMLLFGMTGKNLTGACRLIYKLSKNSENDTYLVESNLPELLLEKGIARITPVEECESVVYGYGALRFLISCNTVAGSDKNTSIAKRMYSGGIIQLLTIHLQLFNDQASTKGIQKEYIHALFQLSEVLREIFNYISISCTDDDGISLDDSVNLVALQLLTTFQICRDEIEMQLQILKTLSVISEIEQCNKYLSENISVVGGFLKPLRNDLRSTKKGIVFICRLGYIIGNIMAQYDETRVKFYQNNEIMSYLIEALDFYANENFIKDTSGFLYNRTDVLVKLVRIVANLSVNPQVGSEIGHSSLGVIILQILLQVKDPKALESEELLQATLGTIHNISYYQDENESLRSENPRSFYKRMNDIALVLCKILQSSSNIIVRLEAAKILGNISRLPNISECLSKQDKMKIFISCLQTTEDFELLCAIVGIFVNILADWEKRLTFKELNGNFVLKKLLIKAIELHNWNLATLCCQAFWNFLTDCTDIRKEIGVESSQEIGNCIAENLDEQALFNGSVPDDWESFAIVASDLLERLQYLSSN
uniref:CSON009166 protein n=1 Tax=Culicoides sonorensis TaxID=179676 RepID=A0A336LNK2_CULSO